jgi:predicted Zn-dependent protease
MCLEALEDRITPASFGFPWPDAQHLTLSFVPDSTVVGNSASNFFARAGSQATAWELEILRAFQTWAVQTHVNIGLVSDSGAALGTPGQLQGDPRFGDIRIAFVPGGNQSEATAVPFDITAGTWSGDVIFNSSDLFAINPPSGSGLLSTPIYDLYSVALHEAGHALGVAGNTTDPSSAMFEFYNDVRTGLNNADIAAIQNLYGPPPTVGSQWKHRPGHVPAGESSCRPRRHARPRRVDYDQPRDCRGGLLL